MDANATVMSLTDKRVPTLTGRQVMIRLAPYGMVLLFMTEIVIFSVLAPTTFATWANLNVVASNSIILGLITLALLVPLLAGEIDASLPAVLTITSLTSAALMSYLGWAFIPAVVAALAVATLVGTLNGLIVVRLSVPSLIATLGTFTIATAAITGLAGGRVIEKGLPSEMLKALSEPRPLGIPLPLFYLAAVALLIWFVTERTALGRHWKAIGTSEPSARMAGIRTNKLRLLAFSTGGFLAGVAGITQLIKAQLGSPNVGPDLLFPGLTAAFLSAAAFRLGSYNVRGALIAIALIQFGVTGLVLVGAPYWTDHIFTGLALILSLVLVRIMRPVGK
jgi:ribose transport system permease protein